MISRSIIATALAGGLLLAGCTQNTGNKEVGGTLLGAGLGGLAGAQFGGGTGKLAATAVGVLAGAWLGNEVGKSLDRADRLAMHNTTQNTLESKPSGTTSSWSNPDSGHSGTVTPQPYYTNSNNQYCRPYTQTVTIDGRTEKLHGTACRNARGEWEPAASG
ncbi:MAG: RT0821/Lpp0805 family surface protein [Rhodospirillales bacterium]